jgi:hypothetical protein
MDDAKAVRVRERRQRLHAQLGGLRDRQRAFAGTNASSVSPRRNSITISHCPSC